MLGHAVWSSALVETVEYLVRATGVMGDRLGPILFQLPPQWRVNRERLAAFLEALPQRYRYAFEFRDPNWFHLETYRLLERTGVGHQSPQPHGHQSRRSADENRARPRSGPEPKGKSMRPCTQPSPKCPYGTHWRPCWASRASRSRR